MTAPAFKCDDCGRVVATRILHRPTGRWHCVCCANGFDASQATPPAGNGPRVLFWCLLGFVALVVAGQVLRDLR